MTSSPRTSSDPVPDIEFASNQARTTAGSGATIDGLAALTSLRVQLDVTAVSGVRPSLTVVIEDLIGGTWHTIGTFAAKTTVGCEVIDIAAPFARSARARWAVAGEDASFTFNVLAYAQQRQRVAASEGSA